MRNKAAAMSQRVLRALASVSIGYALGRVHQRARDEGRVNAAHAFGKGTLQSFIDYLRAKEGERDE